MVDPRWRTVLTVTPYLVLGLLVAFALAARWGDWNRLVPEFVLCAGYAVSIVVFRDLRIAWRRPAAATAAFLTVVIALNLALVLLDSWFAFLTVATFTFAYSLTEWPWELLAVGATATVAGLAQSSGLGADAMGFAGRAVIVAVNVTIMCGLSWGLRLAQRQQERTATKAATEAERSRLAREIHDTLAQGFAGIVTQLQAAEQAPDVAARDRHTGSALALARDGLAEARRSVQALRPVALDSVTLPQAIGTTARRWSERTGVAVNVDTSGEPAALSTNAEVALLRTAQEALANVERHARARHVVLKLRYDRRGASLEVRDDGCGFEPGPAQQDPSSGGYGLTAMRERMEALSGRLLVESASGRGTAIRAEVPA
ncbi:histidine kinase [Leifsonia sp. NPDC058292]|uniref:histidine kinase n=1 Tax=Leifsonia sp. NPDC058292 TaxID=3346428 RepID=UPI0036D92F4D